MSSPDWPYPRWIVHLGAGTLAPENTMAALRLSSRFGHRMFECDAKLSSDGVPFLMHDATLDRTTNSRDVFGSSASNVAGDHTWHDLSQLDAGSWHSRVFAGEPPATLENASRFCLRNNCLLNIEIKPTPGVERLTGHVVAAHAARQWAGRVPPLLTSFQTESLEGARVAAAHLPRGLLLGTLWSGWLDTALSLECAAIVCDHPLWNSSSVDQARNAGFRCLSYTVNDESEARRLWELGTDGIITDRIDLFAPA